MEDRQDSLGNTSKDDAVIKNVTIQYKNSSEKSFRYTRRCVRLRWYTQRTS